MTQTDMQKRIQNQVDQTLDAFDAKVPPPTDPWFFDRLTNTITHESLDSKPDLDNIIMGILRPGMLAGLLALNVLLMVWVFKPADVSSTGRTTYIESLSTEYGLNFSDAYLLGDNGE